MLFVNAYQTASKLLNLKIVTDMCHDFLNPILMSYSHDMTIEERAEMPTRNLA